MKFVPRREKARKGFTSTDGLNFLATVAGSNDPQAGKGHISIGDGRLGRRGITKFAFPTQLNKKELTERSKYYKDVHGIDPADDYKGKGR